jgi:AAHS family 4-hydroxybenzoate transporter-like MFS transporter
MTTIDVGQLIDGEKIGRFHWVAFALCFILLIFDGFDSQAAGYVAPALVRDWHLNRAVLGPLFSIGSLGFVLGAMGFGIFADRYGRRSALIGCVLFFGVFSFSTAWATNLPEIFVLRFLAGLGIGGAMPNGIALLSEYYPARLRSTIMMLGGTGYALGSALCGMVGAYVVPNFGWQALFMIGGIAPLLLLLLWLPLLPESIRFMVLHQLDPNRIRRMLQRMYPHVAIAADARFIVIDENRPGFTVAHLFREGRTAATLLLWLAVFCNLLVLSFLLNWLPTLASGVGMPMSQALAATAMFSTGGVFGTALLGRPMDKFGPQQTLACALLFVAVPIALVGTVAGDFVPMAALIFVIGFFVAGGNAGGTAVSGLLYPTFIRSTGVGWSLGVGRSAAFIAPLLGSVFVTLGLSINTMFYIMAASELVAATAYTAMYVMRPLSRPVPAAAG